MVLKAAWTSAVEQVQTTGSVCRCSTSERNWGAGVNLIHVPRSRPQRAGLARAPERTHRPLPTPPCPGRPAPLHLSLPVRGVHENDVFRELVVGDEDVV